MTDHDANASAPAANEPTPGANDALAGIRARASSVPARWQWEYCYEIGRGKHWSLVDPDHRTDSSGNNVVISHHLVLWGTDEFTDWDEPVSKTSTLAFIAHAPDDVRTLLALIDAQTERVAALTVRLAIVEADNERKAERITELYNAGRGTTDATAPTRETSAPSDTEWNAHLPHPDGWVNPLPHALNVSGRTIHGGPVMIRGDGLDFDGKPLTPPAPDAGATAAKLTRLTKAQWEMVNTLKSGAILRRHWASRTYRNGGERGIPSNVWGKLLKAGLIQEERVGDWFHASLTDAGRAALADATPDGGERP